MPVAYDNVSESHTLITGSISEASFQWTHTPIGIPKGILVFVFNSSDDADIITGVTYGGVSMVAVSGGLAADTANEQGNCKAYFLGKNIPSGAQQVVVTRTNNLNEVYAVSISVTASVNITEVTGVTLQQNNQAPAQASIDDGTLYSNSQRFAGAFYGGSGLPGAGANSTAIADIDFGLRTIQVVRETTPGQGSRLVGFTNATSDDWACVLLAVREAVPTLKFNNYLFPSSVSAGVISIGEKIR